MPFERSPHVPALFMFFMGIARVLVVTLLPVSSNGSASAVCAFSTAPLATASAAESSTRGVTAAARRSCSCARRRGMYLAATRRQIGAHPEGWIAKRVSFFMSRARMERRHSATPADGAPRFHLFKLTGLIRAIFLILRSPFRRLHNIMDTALNQTLKPGW